MDKTQGAYQTFTGEEKVGNKAQRGKNHPRSPRGQETAPSLQRQCWLHLCRTAVRGVGPTPAGCHPRHPRHPRPTPGSSAQPSGMGVKKRPGTERLLGRAPTPRSILQRTGRAQRPPGSRRGDCSQRLAGTSYPPAPGALTRPCAHLGASGAGRRSVNPEVTGSDELGRRRGPGKRGDQQAAPGRARRRGALLQRSRMGSVVPGGAQRPRGGGPSPTQQRFCGPHLYPLTQ
ncbi:Hypothetical predicted protein [Marmota monax]|uniref:Uncharacterized protein n=1 Tax=Marmota monax TaxID=9995 RepID=A0A5E4BM77_MARMO|nr:Hypothetical predicted protein [Marmota monax]